MVERPLRMREVGGSMPSASIPFCFQDALFLMLVLCLTSILLRLRPVMSRVCQAPIAAIAICRPGSLPDWKFQLAMPSIAYAGASRANSCNVALTIPCYNGVSNPSRGDLTLILSNFSTQALSLPSRKAAPGLSGQIDSGLVSQLLTSSTATSILRCTEPLQQGL